MGLPWVIIEAMPFNCASAFPPVFSDISECAFLEKHKEIKKKASNRYEKTTRLLIVIPPDFTTNLPSME
jgi:hypothetical protein